MQNSSGVEGMVRSTAKKDKELMLQIAGYDSSAFEQLYDRYSPLLYSFIKVIAKDQIPAEEILTEVFKIVWNRIDDFDFRTNNVYTWLISLTRNKTTDALKRLRNNSELPEYDDEFEKLNIVPKLSQEIVPLEISEAFNLKSRVLEEFKKLTDAQRYVLNLIYFEGMSETEVADKLHIPAPTVRTKLQVAFGNLFDKTTIIN